jgi:hypothetical protein
VFVRTGYHTQVLEISSKLNGKKKISFHMGHITFACGAWVHRITVLKLLLICLNKRREARTQGVDLRE